MKKGIGKFLVCICLILSFCLALASCEDISGILAGIQNGDITESDIENYLNGKTPAELYTDSNAKYESAISYSVNVNWTKVNDPTDVTIIKLVYDGDDFSADITTTENDGASNEKVIYKNGKMYYKDKHGHGHSYNTTKEDARGYVEYSTPVKDIEPAFPKNHPDSWFEDQKFEVDDDRHYSSKIEIDEKKSKEHEKHSDFYKSGSVCKFNFTPDGILESIVLENVEVNGDKSNITLTFSWELTNHVEEPADKDNYPHKGDFDYGKGHKPGDDLRGEDEKNNDNNDNSDDGNSNPDGGNDNTDGTNEPHTTHTYGEWCGNTATCTEPGTESRSCVIEGCDYTETRNTEPLGHDEVQHKAKPATCVAIGHEAYVTCSRCDYSTYQPIMPSHNYDNGVCIGCMDSEGLVLIYNGKAQFNVVYTESSGAEGKSIADSFVASLRELGIEVSDPISDLEASLVTDCELIIGANVKNRAEELVISDKHLGADGSGAKVSGSSVVIATGDISALSAYFDSFVENVMGITDSTESLSNLSIDKNYFDETLTTYPITSITIAGVSLGEFVFINGANNTGYSNSDIESFIENLYERSGIWLEVGSIENKDSYAHSFIVRYVEDAGESGFRTYVDGDDFIVECSYANAFNGEFKKFACEKFLNKIGNIVIRTDFLYTAEANIAYYEDFGAIGDGVSCDFNAIYNTHVYANAGGQKVMSRGGEDATYYISPANFNKSIPVKTNVDFCGATFIIDDVGDTAYSYRYQNLFNIEKDNSVTVYGDSDGDGTVDDERFSSATVPYGTTKFDWLVGELETKSLVVIYNSLHKDFVRHGANQNDGNDRIDIFVVDVDGKLAEDTPVAYYFDNITAIEIYRLDDAPITLENGNFYNICCRTVAATEYKNDYTLYKRGFRINRANVTVSGINHDMLDEPSLGEYSHVPSEYYDPEADMINIYRYGSRRESYPYYGFLYAYQTYNFNIVDCNLTAHASYYEDKPATVTTGGAVPDPVVMGSYDLVLEYSANVYLENVIQIQETGLGDSAYWGIMASHGCKNLSLESCEINRFDAHRGFWNAEIRNSTIGHTINVMGGGDFIAENVTKLVGNSFITLRGDYGATFRGDILLKDCHFNAYQSYNTARGTYESDYVYSRAIIINSGFSGSNSGWSSTSAEGAYWQWDFGYTCYMPINITVDNFTCDAENLYLFNDLPDDVFTYTYDDSDPGSWDNVTNVYQITKSITYKNMDAAIPICSSTSTNYSMLNSIPVTTENIGTEEE